VAVAHEQNELLAVFSCFERTDVLGQTSRQVDVLVLPSGRWKLTSLSSSVSVYDTLTEDESGRSRRSWDC
jgi:hypothetical protein